MIFGGWTSDQQVINIPVAERQAPENFVHKSLESLTGVSETKRHTEELEEAEGCGASNPWACVGDHVQRGRPTAGRRADDAKFPHVLKFLPCNS